MKQALAFIARHWAPVSAALLAFVTALSLTPLEHLPEVAGGDKWHHLIAWAAVMFPAALRRPEGLPVIAMFFLGWSGGIELIQPYVNRYAEWGDFAANAAGLACGWLISLPMAGMRANAAADASK